jgi:lipopolysaccharide export system protein LptA
MTKTGSSIPKNSLIFFIGLICLLAFSAQSQAQKKKKVEILNADVGAYNERIVANAQRLLGNVNITIDGALMWCDSMYSYINNSVDAFGNVHIIRGDTLDMYADFIHYNPDTKLAKARRNVKLIDKQVTLTTDSLDYNMANDLASYNYSGTVKDTTNVLTSKIGQYYVNEKKAYFKTKVDVVTKDYRIKSDTLIYFTNSKKVFLEGPTHIFNEKDTLYAEYGWYDSLKGISKLTKKPRIWNAKQNVKADSILYDKEKGEGLALGHAHIQDIENSIIVVGNRIQYNDITKMAYATDSAVLIQYSETDSLFLHADRLRTMPDTTKTKKIDLLTKDKKPVLKPTGKTQSNPIPAADSLMVKLNVPDSLKVNRTLPDSMAVKKAAADSLALKPPKDARLVLAYHKVRFFRDDLQGKCDSLAYFSKDSTIQLYTEPVIWSGKNQMSASYIEMINRSKDPDMVIMKEDAFIISMEDDSIRYNQIKGKNMIGFVRKNELYRIDVNGNGQSNYFAHDDKGGIIGLNKAQSSNIIIYLYDGKVKKIAFINSPEGELKPMADIEEGDKLLPGFKWLSEIRPINKDDIFRTPAAETEITLPKKKEPSAPEEK